MKKLIPTTTLITLFLVNTLTGQNNNEIKQDTLGEIVLESTYIRKANTILPVASITSETIENYSPVDLVQALNQNPGVHILSGALNTNRLTIRGVGSRTPFGTNKIRAYFNEIPITNGTGETSIEVYDPEMIQRIDIVKGPKATVFGSNLGGAILLKPMIAESSYLKNSFTVGSFGLIKNSAGFGYTEDKISMTFDYGHLSLDGYRQNSNYNRNTIFFNLGYKLNENNEIDFLFNKINFKAHIPSSLNETDFEENPRLAAQNWFNAQGYEDTDYTLLGLTYSHLFSNNFKNATTIFYSYTDHYEPAPFAIMDDYTNSFGIRTVFSGKLNLFNKNIDYTIGGELFKDVYNWDRFQNLYEDNSGSVEGDLTSDNKENRNHLNAFSTATINLSSKLKAQLGLNLNITNYDFIDNFNSGTLNENAKRNFDPILAPSLNLVYNINDFNSIYGNVSKGFSFPSFEETLNPDGLINPDIKPETGMNYEIGFNFSFFENKLRLSSTGYIMSIKNLLVAQRVEDDQYIGRNAGKTSHKGIETLIEFNTGFSSLKISPFVNSTFNFHKFVDFIDDEIDYSGNELTGVADKNISAGLRIEHNNGLFLIGTLQHVGKIPITDANSLYSDPFTILNTKVGFRKTFNNRITFEINAGINNFTDKKYARSVLINASGFGGALPRYYYPGDPINYFSGLKVKYLF